MDVEIGLAEALCPGSRTYILQKFCQKLAEDCRSVVRSLQKNVALDLLCNRIHTRGEVLSEVGRRLQKCCQKFAEECCARPAL